MAEPQEDTSRTFDGRRRDFFIIDNELFDSGIAAAIGPSATAIYLFLIRRTNRNDECWPSRLGIAEAVGLGKDTVSGALETLQQCRLIERLDDGDRYHFMILDKTHWVVPVDTKAKKSPTDQGEKIALRGRKSRLQPGEKIAPKKTQRTKPIEENTVTPPAAPGGVQTELLTESPAPPKLPGNLKSETWDKFKVMRKKIRAPMTDDAERLLILDLKKLISDGENAQAVVEQSIKNSWRGVFPVRDPGRRQEKRELTYAEWEERNNPEELGKRVI